jgi:hypothetical protein
MAINFQAVLDARVAQMLKSDSEKAMEKTLVAEFDDIVLSRVQMHQEAIEELKAKPNGNTINAAAIAFHERRLAYYMS